MSATETETLVAECPTCETPMTATPLYRTFRCESHGGFYHDPDDEATGAPGLGWLHLRDEGL